MNPIQRQVRNTPLPGFPDYSHRGSQAQELGSQNHRENYRDHVTDSISGSSANSDLASPSHSSETSITGILAILAIALSSNAVHPPANNPHWYETIGTAGNLSENGESTVNLLDVGNAQGDMRH
jgi:hypothetical protein